MPIPRLRGLDHVGLIVADVEAATTFFADLLGARTLYDIGPFEDRNDWMAAHLTTHPAAHLHRLRVLEVAHGPVLELLEETHGQSAISEPAASTAGVHLAFYVDDMEAALAALKAHGTPISSGPVTMTEGPSAGLEWLYCRAPWGLQIELVSYPGGIAAYRALGRGVGRS